ncbi:MAG: hypothetical protein Harvfovirus23_2 [Harvfovirus sp.]|uniref:Uncharacterized protein n=1 Tax=Harvfovirus sp. TaxID=2487768 RepID=A0A3G5A297_9VIRU|nr:MAG: hypothetical protein Harvfovirus23_2 [Harvfovirus sp.]
MLFGSLGQLVLFKEIMIATEYPRSSIKVYLVYNSNYNIYMARGATMRITFSEYSTICYSHCTPRSLICFITKSVSDIQIEFTPYMARGATMRITFSE